MIEVMTSIKKKPDRSRNKLHTVNFKRTTQAAVCKHRSQFTDNLLIQLWHTAFSHVFLCTAAANTLPRPPKDVVLLLFFMHVSCYQILTDRDATKAKKPLCKKLYLFFNLISQTNVFLGKSSSLTSYYSQVKLGAP